MFQTPSTHNQSLARLPTVSVATKHSWFSSPDKGVYTRLDANLDLSSHKDSAANSSNGAPRQSGPTQKKLSTTLFFQNKEVHKMRLESPTDMPQMVGLCGKLIRESRDVGLELRVSELRTHGLSHVAVG